MHRGLYFHTNEKSLCHGAGGGGGEVGGRFYFFLEMKLWQKHRIDMFLYFFNQFYFILHCLGDKILPILDRIEKLRI